MICRNCGNLLPEGARFCGVCGTGCEADAEELMLRTQETVEEAAQEIAEENVEEAAEEAAEEIAEENVEEAAEEAAEEIVEEAAEEAAEEIAEEAAEEAAEENVEEAAEEAAEEVVEEIPEPILVPVMEPVQYVPQQNPYVAQQNPYAAQQNPYAAQQNPYVAQQNPYAAQQNPYVAQQNPYAAQQNPYTAQQNPYVAQQNPYAAQQNPYAAQQNPYAAQQYPYAAPRPMPQPPMPPRKPAAPAKKPLKPLPSAGVRVTMQILSGLFCLLLIVSLLGTMLLLDLRQLTSAKNLEKVIDSLFNGSGKKSSSEYAPLPSAPQIENGYGAITMSDSDFEFDFDELPEDILAGGDSEENKEALMEWLYEHIKESNPDKIKFTEEQFFSFVENSTVTDYISEKLAGFAEDILKGTENTEITTEELMDLMKENEEALEEELNVVLDQKTLDSLEETFTEVVEEQEINETIRETANEAIDEVVQESVGMKWSDVQKWMRMLSSVPAILVGFVLCLLLIALLLILNYYNPSAGLVWAGAAGLIAGLVAAVPVIILQVLPDTLVNMIPALETYMGLVDAFVAVLAPVHYGVLIGGVVLLIGAIVWRVAASKARRQRIMAV